MKPYRLVGLDLETTGSDAAASHVIQLGVYVPSGEPLPRRPGELRSIDVLFDVLSLDVCPIGWEDVDLVRRQRALGDPFYAFSEDARRVNGFTDERVAAGVKARKLDVIARGCLDQLAPEVRLVPVGWNVGSFDMPILRRELPETARRFGYHAVDLNSLVYALADGPPAFDDLKRRAKDYAAERAASYGIEAQPHDAGYDAFEAVLAFGYLRRVLREPCA